MCSTRFACSTIEQREIEAPNGKQVQVSLDFIQEKGTQIGALLTMRDAESVRRIEDEIELRADFPPADGSPAASPTR